MSADIFIHGELGPTLGVQSQSVRSASVFREPDMASQIETWRQAVTRATEWINLLTAAAEAGGEVTRFVGGESVTTGPNPRAVKTWRTYLVRTKAKLKAANPSS